MMIPDCKSLIGFLDDYIERRLPLSRRVAFDVPLAMCRSCRRYLRSYRKTVALAKEARDAEDAAPPPMPEDMVRAILDSMKQSGGRGAE